MSTSAMSDEKQQDTCEEEEEHHENEEEEEEEGDEPKSYMEIDQLALQKISTADIKKCRDAGFYTVESIAYIPKKQLLEIKGISEAKVEKLQTAGNTLSESIYALSLYALILFPSPFPLCVPTLFPFSSE